MNVALGADHAGVELKNALKAVLDDLGVAYVDFGTSSTAPVDYPDFAPVERGVASGAYDRGILSHSQRIEKIKRLELQPIERDSLSS